MPKQTEITMPQYRNWKPTTHDTRGLSLPDRQDWHVMPIMMTRDTTDPLTISNWAVIVRDLNASVDVEIHRFNHWACGWFEIILVRPDTDACREAQELADAMESYPILDDSDFTAREMEAGAEIWRNMTARERVGVLRKLHFKGCVLAARRDEVPYDDSLSESIETYLASHNS